MPRGRAGKAVAALRDHRHAGPPVGSPPPSAVAVPLPPLSWFRPSCPALASFVWSLGVEVSGRLSNQNTFSKLSRSTPLFPRTPLVRGGSPSPLASAAGTDD